MRRFSGFFEQKHSEVRHQRQRIKEAVSGGANTVDKISEATKMPKELVVWNLMGLLKWGQVEVCGEVNHEPVYAIKEA
ncbi:MAG: hypothetical protein ACFFEF_12260 [Candidatus Thorarchaeota archaeon]